MTRYHHRLLKEVFSCCLGVRGSFGDPSVDTGIQRCLPPTIQLSRGCSDRWCPRAHTHTHTHTHKPFSYKGCRKYPRHLGMFIFVFRLVSLHFYRGSISQMPTRDEPPNREPFMRSLLSWLDLANAHEGRATYTQSLRPRLIQFIEFIGTPFESIKQATANSH